MRRFQNEAFGKRTNINIIYALIDSDQIIQKIGVTFILEIFSDFKLIGTNWSKIIAPKEF